MHALFTLSGRASADSCKLAQPDFATALANRNVIFRIPTPVFGAGLIEMIPDSALLGNQAASAPTKSSLGIRHFDCRRKKSLHDNRLRVLSYAVPDDGECQDDSARLQDGQSHSDLLLHDLGVGLSDGISQGEAGPREFRAAPLWGLGQRIFFLHDGRTSDLIAAIRAHQSVGSEANVVVSKYVNLTEKQKQDLLNFLRSL